MPPSPPPQHPESPHLDPPHQHPELPHLDPPPTDPPGPPPPAPPITPSFAPLERPPQMPPPPPPPPRGLRPTVSWGGSWRPEPRGCPPRGANLLAGQELVGMFAYRLVSGHCRVQTGVARTGEAGTVTTAGVFGLNVLTGWEQRRAEWVDVAWLAMRVPVGRQRKMGVADVIDVEEDEPPPTRAERASRRGHAPPHPKPRVRPSRRSGQCGRSRRSRWGAGGRGGWCRSGWTSSGRGRGRHARSARRPPTATSRPVCPGPTRTGGTASRGWRTSPSSVTGWPPR